MADTFNFDVFLSHNGKDKPAVEHIARLLRDEYNLRVWLDKWNLVPGEPWQDALEDALDDCQTFAVFLGPSGIGPWENEEMRSAIEDRVRDPKRRVIPVLLPGAPDNKDLDLPRFLRRATWVDFRPGLDDKEALYHLYCGITGQAPGDRGSAISPKIPTMADWYLAHPYPMPPNFTGRRTERNMLTGWLNTDKDHPLLIIRALGGFGKSALSWHWLTHDINPKQFPKVVFWSFYEGDASFENFLRATLFYLGVINVDQLGTRQQAELLLSLLQHPGILLILDGFERVLRAYGNMGAAYQGDELQEDNDDSQDTSRDCINTFSDRFLGAIGSYGYLMKSKVLITTRLTPRAVEKHGQFLQGVREEELKAMQKDDAVEFFRARRISGTQAEIEAACKPYGYHPLSLRILTGLIANDRTSPGDIAVTKDLEITKDIIQNKHHILEVGFNTLSLTQRKLLGRIACFRTAITYDALKTLHDDGNNHLVLDESLKILESRGLLHWDRKSNKYDLHPIVRRFAYDRLTIPDRTGAHERLVNYFEAVPKPKKVQKLDDLTPVIELYHHMIRAGKLDEAFGLFLDRITTLTYYQFGAYQLRIELLQALFSDGKEKTPRLKEAGNRAWVLNALANAYSVSGQPHRAVPVFQNAILFAEKIDNWTNVVIALGNLAYMVQIHIGALREAEDNLHRSIELSGRITDKFWMAAGHNGLGRVLSYRGIWDKAEERLNFSFDYHTEQKDYQSLSLDYSYRALRFLLMARDTSQSPAKNHKSAIESASQALRLAGETARTRYPFPHDFIDAYRFLGAAYCANGDLNKAEENLSKAISMCRHINLVEVEADILLNLAHLRSNQKNYEEAKSLAEEAILITERCGYVLQGADVNLFLAELTLTLDPSPLGRGKAREYAETALKLAYCDGPPYYYKVAYHETERFLENLK